MKKLENTHNRTNKVDVIKMLGYSAAALSVVSFLTTLNGLKGVVTDSTIYAALISFGIQSIILVMGLWFITASKTIWKQKVGKALRIIVILLMIVTYICSVAFSSFFSFVYLANAAYFGVRPIDYNMELEMFLVERTKEVKNINNAINSIMLRNIRESAPRFKTLMDKYKSEADKKVQEIINQKTKYKLSTIPDKDRFNASYAITAFEGANRRTADSRLVEDCQRLENDVNEYVDRYRDRYYPAYSYYFDNMSSLMNISEVASRTKDIENTITSMKSETSLLAGFKYEAYGSIDNYVKGRCNIIIAYYNDLIEKFEEIISTYDRVATDPEVIQGEGLILQNFYEAIYSTNILTEQELENAENELKNIISAYIQSADMIDEESIASLSQCIEYLDILNRSKAMKDKIEKYEEENLAVTYIVSSELSSENNADSIRRIGEEVWNEARHRDVSEFISIIKLLPDLDLILPNVDESQFIDDANIRYLIEKDDEDYIATALSKAYEYSRAKLENISDMERARNFLFSENRFLAVFCCLISVFLDAASFFIGLCMYACQGSNQDK